jgi:hypothetical protein
MRSVLALACAGGLAVSGAACAIASPRAASAPSIFESCARSNCAWWLTAVFEPTDSLIEGIRVNRIRSDWDRASVLTLQMMPPAAAADPSNLADTSHTSFVRDADFNGDGVVDRAVVGVFRTRRGLSGQFLLIVSPAVGPHRRIAFVAAASGGSAGFSVLDWRSTTLTWAACMECDALAVLRWGRGKYSLVAGGPATTGDTLADRRSALRSADSR